MDEEIRGELEELNRKDKKQRVEETEVVVEEESTTSAFDSRQGITTTTGLEINLGAQLNYLFSNTIVRTLNLHSILGSAVDTADNAPAGFRLTSDGAKTLGRPMGSAAFQRAWVADRLARRQPPRSALQLLPCRLRLGEALL